MVIENGKIIECSDSELFQNYLHGEWDMIMSYDDYKSKCINLGVIITE